MRRLGISIYPDRMNIEEIKEYILKASKIGAKRIFSTLLSVKNGKEEVFKKYKEINDFAKKLGFEIILDINPKIFKNLGISYNDLSFFKEINCDGLRLDEGFTGLEESLMTYNKENLKIEINMSNDVSTIDTIMDFMPNRYNLLGCHNFYPQKYTGLGLEFFKKSSSRFKKYGINTAAFVGTTRKNAIGPHEINEGLATLEMHRNLDLDIQIKHHIALDCVEDILISNCYPSDEEFEKLSKLDLSLLTFDVDILVDLSETEKNILFNELHFNRGDVNENMIRSTQTRVKYAKENFLPKNVKLKLEKGDVVIKNSNSLKYKGELQIILNEMENDNSSNVVAKIRKEEIFLLDLLKAWQKFKIKINK